MDGSCFSTVPGMVQELWRMIYLHVYHCSVLKYASFFTVLPIYIFIYLYYKQSTYTEAARFMEEMPVIIFIWCHLSCGKTFIGPLCQCNTLWSYRSFSWSWIILSRFLQIKLVIATYPHHLLSTSGHSFQTTTGLWVNYGTFKNFIASFVL